MRHTHQTVLPTDPTARQRLQSAVGKKVTDYVITVRTADGEVWAVFPSEQDPRITDELAKKGAKVLGCGPDCTCRRES